MDRLIQVTGGKLTRLLAAGLAQGRVVAEFGEKGRRVAQQVTGAKRGGAVCPLTRSRWVWPECVRGVLALRKRQSAGRRLEDPQDVGGGSHC